MLEEENSYFSAILIMKHDSWTCASSFFPTVVLNNATGMCSNHVLCVAMLGDDVFDDVKELQ